jgi:hypothetical protein
MTADLRRCSGIDAQDIGKNNNINRYLCDLRGAPNIESVSQNYDFAYEGASEAGLSRNARSALLTDPDDNTHNFIETLLRNAGFMVKIFVNREEAVAWLEE